MSTINRLLSRKDKQHGSPREKPKQRGGLRNGLVLSEDTEHRNEVESHEDRKIRLLIQRLSHAGIHTFKEADIEYVLAGAYSQGDSEKAYELLVLLEDSEKGIIRSYDPQVKLLGAVNREGVTCYLDALLFAMFARLGSFEAMLYKNFEDPPRKQMATLLRLWGRDPSFYHRPRLEKHLNSISPYIFRDYLIAMISNLLTSNGRIVNTLRAGKLITTDITKQIQLQLSECGWKEAAELCQQDTSEAFTFITSTLALPLLTLKMDIFHTGKEDVSDDHKFINERVLELAIPDVPPDGHVTTLEECLELYFNNRIEVKRYLDQLERRNTLNSVRSRQSIDSTKAHTSHIEVAEISDVSQPSSPVAGQPQPFSVQSSPIRPTMQRKRAPSIIQEHYIDEKKGLHDDPLTIDENGPPSARVKKEVMMPAWQFFSLIPWYTNNIPSNDAQVAAHFSSTRPVLGICLKRYSMLPNGTAVKRNTHIDIPLEIGLPHFIQDDTMAADGPAFGNFKLSLQSVVCHQGVSTESGHYISLVRCPDPDQPGEDRWMRFDDLANERVTYTNVETFLLHESPYLLFYQVVPIEGDPSYIASSGRPSISDELPPAYSESDGSRQSKVDSGVSGVSSSPRISYSSNRGPISEFERPSLELCRPSSDTSASEDDRRGRSSNTSERPQSITFPDVSANGARGVKTDLLSTRTSEISQSDGPNTLTASRRGSKATQTTQESSKSRPNSRADDKRMSASLSRLANRMSKDKLNKTAGVASNGTGSKVSVNGSTPPSEPVNDPPPAPTSRSAAFIAASEKFLAARESPADRGRLKKETKEKSKATHRDDQHLIKGKRKDEKPDRECSVM